MVERNQKRKDRSHKKELSPSRAGIFIYDMPIRETICIKGKYMKTKVKNVMRKAKKDKKIRKINNSSYYSTQRIF